MNVNKKNNFVFHFLSHAQQFILMKLTFCKTNKIPDTKKLNETVFWLFPKWNSRFDVRLKSQRFQFITDIALVGSIKSHTWMLKYLMRSPIAVSKEAVLLWLYVLETLKLALMEKWKKFSTGFPLFKKQRKQFLYLNGYINELNDLSVKISAEKKTAFWFKRAPVVYLSLAIS